jgi:hypothetical protein
MGSSDNAEISRQLKVKAATEHFAVSKRGQSPQAQILIDRYNDTILPRAPADDGDAMTVKKDAAAFADAKINEFPPFAARTWSKSARAQRRGVA